MVGLLASAVAAGCGGVGESTHAATGGSTDGGAVDGGSASGGGGAPDPFAVAPTCTSGMNWTRGDHGSSEMNPGRACIACHTTMNGPPLTIAGTIYPTAHEPDLCDGADGSNGARIEITGADGQTLALTPNASGNFDSGARVAFPFTVRVTYAGRTRAMTAAQTSGDCNGCHTQAGASNAPGRILLP